VESTLAARGNAGAAERQGTAKRCPARASSLCSIHGKHPSRLGCRILRSPTGIPEPARGPSAPAGEFSGSHLLRQPIGWWEVPERHWRRATPGNSASMMMQSVCSDHIELESDAVTLLADERRPGTARSKGSNRRYISHHIAGKISRGRGAGIPGPFMIACAMGILVSRINIVIIGLLFRQIIDLHQ
jgi:hypothetical protein